MILNSNMYYVYCTSEEGKYNFAQHAMLHRNFLFRVYHFSTCNNGKTQIYFHESLKLELEGIVKIDYNNTMNCKNNCSKLEHLFEIVKKT